MRINIISYVCTIIDEDDGIALQGFKPAKMFSIDRVFRNETLDATHLAEFHQVEGVVAERGLSLAHVMGLFTEFFRKCGQFLVLLNSIT